MGFCSVGPEFEDFAEPGGCTGVDEKGALISPELFPVSAAKCGKTVDWNKALITLPPENNLQILKMWTPKDTNKHQKTQMDANRHKKKQQLMPTKTNGDK